MIIGEIENTKLRLPISFQFSNCSDKTVFQNKKKNKKTVFQRILNLFYFNFLLLTAQLYKKNIALYVLKLLTFVSRDPTYVSKVGTYVNIPKPQNLKSE